jgi:hypothetical protein
LLRHARYKQLILLIYLIVFCLGCSSNTANNSPKYFEKGCASVYYQTKSGVVFTLSILTLAAAGAILLALIFYGVVSQRARAGYAAVSRG